MLNQIWACGACREVGKISHKKDEDLMTVVHLIEDDHQKQSPSCSEPVNKILVMNGTIEELPEWAQEPAKQLCSTEPGDNFI